MGRPAGLMRGNYDRFETWNVEPEPVAAAKRPISSHNAVLSGDFGDRRLPHRPRRQRAGLAYVYFEEEPDKMVACRW
jgi:hypothetical protein